MNQEGAEPERRISSPGISSAVFRFRAQVQRWRDHEIRDATGDPSGDELLDVFLEQFGELLGVVVFLQFGDLVLFQTNFG